MNPPQPPPHPMLAAAADRISGAERIWLGTHLDPDGDAIGSLLGLGHILAARGHAVTLACQDPPAREVAFLPGVERITHSGPDNHDLAIALDAADAGRLGRLFTPSAWSQQPTIVVDHHISNPGFGDINVIDPTAASTAELVIELADQLGAAIDEAAATCLLTAIVTDTLGFRTSNTTARSLACAGRMVGLGASLADISQRVFFTRPLASLRLTGRALDHLEIDGPFALAWISQADLAEFGIGLDETQDLTRLLSTAAEPIAIALVRERADGQIDVSLRSKPGVDVVPAAKSLGGGGHPQAAGARIPGPLDNALGVVRRAMAAHVAVPLAVPTASRVDR
jgi:phosphoesterase RecJ-like protein